MGDSTANIQQQLYAAVQFLQSGEFEKARACFEQALAGDPDHFDALHLFGVLEHRMGRFDHAEELISRALALNPEFADAHFNLGRVLEDRGRLEDAAGSYRNALEREPGLDVAHFNLGLVLGKMGRWPEAVESLQQAIRIQPNDPDYHFNLGNACRNLNQDDNARASFEAAIRLDPGLHQAHNNLGILQRAAGRYPEAIAAYRRALELRPDYADGYFNLGNTCEEAGALDQARAAYEQAIHCRPGMAKAYNNLGNVHHAQGNMEKAREAYRKAVELDPASFSAAHILNSLEGKAVDHAPIQYVETLFDKAAGDFEHRLVDDLKYDSPRELHAEMVRLLGPEARFESAIDLGCGTGLSGAPFRPMATHLSGVDISSKMVARARQKNLYDELAVGELVDCLNRSERRFDLFIAADVLAYFGDLKALFGAVRDRARPGARFLFTIEGVEEADYLLRKTGRFAHSRAYIDTLARDFGFTVESCLPTVVRMENDRPIDGFNLILKLT